MIEQVIGWGLVIQRYFLSLCQYITFYIKRLGALTASTSVNGGGNSGSSSNGLNQHYHASSNSNLCHFNLSTNVSDSKQAIAQIKKSRLKPSSQIPGGRCLPVFGTLFEFNKFGSRRVHELAVERHSKYGDIFREKLLSQELVFVANTDLLKQWMAQEGKLPMSLKQDPSLIFAECCPYLKRGLFFRNGEEWHKLRKLGHTIVHKNASDFESHGLFDSCEDFFENYMKTLQQEVSRSESGLINDIEMRSYDIAFGATMNVVYGKNAAKFESFTGTDFAALSRNAKELNEHHQKLLEIPARVAKWLQTTAWTGYASKLHHNLTSCIKFAQLSREDILKSPEEASMRSHGLLYKTINLNAPLQDIDDLLTDFAVDTKDPFAGTAMFVAYVLGMHPEIQDKIYEEVSHVYPSNQSTLIMYSSYVAHRDPRYFSDPLKVLPERWINNGQGPNEHNNSEINSHKRLTCDIDAWAPFGLKARKCLGQNIATSLFVMYIANLVRKFKLTTTAESLEIAMQTVLYPINQKPIHFQNR